MFILSHHSPLSAFYEMSIQIVGYKELLITYGVVNTEGDYLLSKKPSFSTLRW